MKRIFTTLAIVAAIALVVSFALGCWSRWGGLSDRLYILHFVFGLFAAIGTIAVHCVVFTYLMGTGRTVREVTLAYHMPDEPLYRRVRDLKRETHPWLIGACLLTITAAAAGMGTQIRAWPWQVHFALTIATLIVNYVVFRIEYRKICINEATIAAMMVEVDRVRAQHGLPPNAVALAEESV